MTTICYCFGYTDAEIVDDIVRHRGNSTIVEKIAEAKRKGTCQCDVKNPQKR